MTEDKGRPVLEGAENRAEKLIYWAATIASLLGIVPVSWIWASASGRNLEFDILPLFALLFLAGSALFWGSRARKLGPTRIHEKGVALGGFSSGTFKPFDGIERVDVWVTEDSAAMRFWRKVIGPWEVFEKLELKEKDRTRDKVLEITEFLRSKGMTVIFKGEAREWAEKEIKCLSCNTSLQVRHIYHAGFSNSGFLYCDRCTNVLVFSSFDPNFESIVGQKHPWTLNEEERRAVERALMDCPCGGKFSFENPLRCPHCNASVRGPLFEEIYYNVVGQVLDGDSQNVWKSPRAES